MNISNKVMASIEKKAPGQVFEYQDIAEYKHSPSAVVKAVSRLVNADKIKRIEKGRFYRPKQGVLGELKPCDIELLKTLLYKNGRLRGYITGLALYNQLGLTTQVPRAIKVATEGAPQKKDFGTLRAHLVKARAPVKQENVPLLQYLDVLRDLKEIPDTDVNDALKRMAQKFAQLDEQQIKRIRSLALKYYNAQEKALTGLLLERTKNIKDESLKSSLNPLTFYKLGLDKEQWPEMKTWNIR